MEIQDIKSDKAPSKTIEIEDDLEAIEAFQEAANNEFKALREKLLKLEEESKNK